MNGQQKISWKKVGSVYVAEFFLNGISIAAEISPDRTSRAVASQIGRANHDSFGAALRLPDGRWFHPAVSRVDRARVYMNAGMHKDRALANAWMEENEAGMRFLEVENGTPHLRLLTVKAQRGIIMEKKEIGGLDMPIPLFGGPCDAYSELANEMAEETAAKVLKAIRDLVGHKAA
ncbi:MAG: hypothetical protein PHQ60_02280 [Sideroxydans sp.]|nr:hypothetical protein [Sideroxydans sp.]MDD5056671.1 hypothetical protein [Sideroxydans sp.]